MWFSRVFHCCWNNGSSWNDTCRINEWSLSYEGLNKFLFFFPQLPPILAQVYSHFMDLLNVLAGTSLKKKVRAKSLTPETFAKVWQKQPTSKHNGRRNKGPKPTVLLCFLFELTQVIPKRHIESKPFQTRCCQQPSGFIIVSISSCLALLGQLGGN